MKFRQVLLDFPNMHNHILIEISTRETRLLFDAGTNLPPLDGPKPEDDFELVGLICGTPSFDWVFLSHHHNDHCGLLKKF